MNWKIGLKKITPNMGQGDKKMETMKERLSSTKDKMKRTNFQKNG